MLAKLGLELAFQPPGGVKNELGPGKESLVIGEVGCVPEGAVQGAPVVAGHAFGDQGALDLNFLRAELLPQVLPCGVRHQLGDADVFRVYWIGPVWESIRCCAATGLIELPLDGDEGAVASGDVTPFGVATSAPGTG